MTPAHDPEDPEAPDDLIARLIRDAGPRPAVPEDRRDRIRQSVRTDWRTSLRPRRSRVFFLVMGVAAALVVVTVAGLWLRQRGGIDGAPIGSLERVDGRVMSRDGRAAMGGALLEPGAELITGPETRAALRLRGGAAVRLDTGTELRLVSARLLEMKHGAIYVDAAAIGPRQEASIELRTPWGLLRDAGTQFEVRIGEDGLRLSVREGVVTLARDDRTYRAPAGTRLRVPAHGAVETEAIAPAGADWAWVLAVTPSFDLDGRTLRDYLDWLSRETAWKVAFTDRAIAAKAATIVLHGSTSGLRPDESPAAVLPTCGLRHRLEGDTLLIDEETPDDRPAGRAFTP